jgi:CheY-like chemotaxis protein
MTDPNDILIVDDAEENVLFISQILEDNGHRFRVARNGRQALAALHEKRPMLVLLDVMMPRKNGFAVFSEMKSDPELSAVPVIIVSGASRITGVDLRTGAKNKSESYGDDLAQRFGDSLHGKLREIEPDGLIEKPIDPDALMKKINQVLG